MSANRPKVCLAVIVLVVVLVLEKLIASTPVFFEDEDEDEDDDEDENDTGFMKLRI